MSVEANVPILLVEDDENDVLLVRRSYKKAGLQFPLQIVQSGDEALKYLAGEGKYADRDRFPMPFLILLDLRMPGRDGFDVLRWLREHPEQGDRITVVVLSSSEADFDVLKAFELGAVTYLVKPMGDEGHLTDLMNLLQKYWPMLKNIVVIRKDQTKAAP